MQNLMKMIRKTITKRDHKLVDYDRFRISLKRLQDKKDRKLSDEKEIFKVCICSSLGNGNSTVASVFCLTFSPKFAFFLYIFNL